MDTPQVQRLRNLKQLATADFVYMGANHSRFEHSLGVAHLADLLCRHLQRMQPKLGITDKDILCVKLAGLFHDLGHGPFSHVYEDLVNKQMKKFLRQRPHLLQHYDKESARILSDPESHWEHENASLMMVDAALEYLGLAIDMQNLDKPLLQIGDGIEATSLRVYDANDDENDKVNMESVLTSRDFVFIKECILGKPLEQRPVTSELSGFIGRPYRRQEFLYDIVSNRHNGLDVDKIDYFARDSRKSVRGNGIDKRFIDEAVVAYGQCPQPDKCHACNGSAPGYHLMICYPEKMLLDGNAMEFFNQRFKLHKSVYHHKTTVAATFMICDILTLADPYFRLPTVMEDESAIQEDEGLPVSQAMRNKTSYLELRDSVIDQIKATRTPELRESRLLIQRLRERNLYKCVAMKSLQLTKPSEAAIWAMSEHEIAEEIVNIRGRHTDKQDRPIHLEEDDFIVEKYKIHHGAGTDNPVDFMRFVPKDQYRKITLPIKDLPTACNRKSNGDGNTPVVMQEQFLRIFCRGGEDKQDLLKHVFELWESESAGEGIVTAECSSDSDSEGEGQRESVPLTQEEEECSFGTPTRGSHRYDSDGEPSPFPAQNRH